MKKVYLIITLLVVGVLSWFVNQYVTQHSFPVISDGFYQGTVVGIKAAESKLPLNLFLRSTVLDDKTKLLNFTIIDSEWTNLTATLRADTNSLNADAIVVEQNGKRLTLWGLKKSDASDYQGGFKIRPDGASGTWSLSKLKTQPGQLESADPSALQHIVLLRAELEGIDQKITAQRERLALAYEQTNKLADFITNPDNLRKHADQRFDMAQTKMQELEVKVIDQLAQVKKMQQQVNLAYRVTQRGALVALARESLEREGRWVESMFRSKVGEERADLTAALGRANQIAEIRRQITDERNLLFQLRMTQEYGQ